MLRIGQHCREDRAQSGVYRSEDFCAGEDPGWAALGHKDAIGLELGLDNIPVEVLCIQLHHRVKFSTGAPQCLLRWCMLALGRRMEHA